ncbi:phosphoadenosine phosphosulfate reductase domain-containing protein [Acetobacter persici]|uniref:Phosphohydrolase n=1 Tax=Acetobacter persici TaxID=1076596 RepID=A0A1U9LJQ1_9PROT|nr:phosphoadenosine phosphosulfate reductase family protein [Acetobacter persici]AQT06652.1 phosphohydrolase [Acetobacter persici]
MSYHDVDDQVVIPGLALEAGLSQKDVKASFFDAPDIDLSIYDNIIVCMSGGKDSIASLLRILEMGADRDKIELWHHEVDGREGSSLMDWRFMTSYNKALAAAFGIPLYFSWLEGGFEGEMLKNNSYGRPHKIETPDGLITLERDTTRARPSTRLKFPQVSANLQTRWCSSALKIDVGRRALNNQARFNGKKVLFITGERREESANRARYSQLERHACDRREGRLARHVDAWRPVLAWSEEQVWDIIARHNVISPVPYRLGWGRSSCMKCIFNDATIWATINKYFPGELDALDAYEVSFDTTIRRDKKGIMEVAKMGVPLEITDLAALRQVTQEDYTLPIFCSDGEWVQPAGAFLGTGCGPS